jgi:hypothetical protein
MAIKSSPVAVKLWRAVHRLHRKIIRADATPAEKRAISYLQSVCAADILMSFPKKKRNRN